ncbi:squalene/phytoene synthase family protein [Sphingomonas sp. FW199]|uniref:squalene/phytoene synthase family protein n=1 Tax=Sphingomonas sp. FW199 TaxID=3400217 RepID=UPI003CFAB33C
MTLRLLENPEVALTIGYAPATLQPVVKALLSLDDSLGAVLRATGQPMLAQLRLAWWRDQLAALDGGEPPAMPVLVEVASAVVGAEVSGQMLADMATGWERLATAEELTPEILGAYAEERGATLFRAVARCAGVGEPAGLAKAGQGWALADLSRHLSDPAAAGEAQGMALAALADAPGRWPGPLRVLGALSLLARMDAAMPLDQPIRHGAPGRVARLALMKLTGR